MARYEYRCRACGDTFELSRPMSEASAPAICPAGHPDTVKLISAVAATFNRYSVGGRTGDATRANKSAAAPGNAGGCCGGGCCG